MVQELKQSTAVVVHIGQFVDVGDGFTPEVEITLTGADEAEVLKHAATTTTSISGLTWAAITGCDGHFALSLGTGETDTLGMFEVIVQDDSVCLPVVVRFEVVTANYWDSKYSTDVRKVDVTQIGGVTQSATDLKDFADAGYDPVTNKVQGVVLVDTCTTNIDVRGTDSAALASVCTETRLEELDGANLPTDVAAVKTDTAAILVDTADMQSKIGTPATDLSADIAAVPTANQNADGLLDRANGIETSLTPREALKVIAAAAGGKLSGAATTTVLIRNAKADSKNRITATVDSDGNRSAVTLDLT